MIETTLPTTQAPQSVWPRRILFGIAIGLAAISVARQYLQHDSPIGQALWVSPRWHGRSLDTSLRWLKAGDAREKTHAAEAIAGMISPRNPFEMNCGGPGPEENRIQLTDFPDIVPTLIEALDDSDPEVRNAVARTLSRCGPHAESAVPKLTHLLHDDRNVVSACAALAAIGPPAAPALGELRKLFVEPNPSVRLAAAEAVWYIAEDPAAIDVCGVLIVDTNFKNRREVFRFLSYAVGPRAARLMPAIVSVLETEFADSKRKSETSQLAGPMIRLLGAIGPDAGPAVPHLIRLFREVEHTDDECLWAFTRIGPPARRPAPPYRS
jgi:hypothetical protein